MKFSLLGLVVNAIFLSLIVGLAAIAVHMWPAAQETSKYMRSTTGILVDWKSWNNSTAMSGSVTRTHYLLSVRFRDGDGKQHTSKMASGSAPRQGRGDTIKIFYDTRHPSVISQDRDESYRAPAAFAFVAVFITYAYVRYQWPNEHQRERWRKRLSRRKRRRRQRPELQPHEL